MYATSIKPQFIESNVSNTFGQVKKQDSKKRPKIALCCTLSKALRNCSFPNKTAPTPMIFQEKPVLAKTSNMQSANQKQCNFQQLKGPTKQPIPFFVKCIKRPRNRSSSRVERSLCLDNYLSLNVKYSISDVLFSYYFSH
jgi:hypothetical protein